MHTQSSNQRHYLIRACSQNPHRWFWGEGYIISSLKNRLDLGEDVDSKLNIH